MTEHSQPKKLQACLSGPDDPPPKVVGDSSGKERSIAPTNSVPVAAGAEAPQFRQLTAWRADAANRPSH
jgi:hypothetical protein